MPAAAVIPAPLAYTIIVAVKRLVVGLNIEHSTLLLLHMHALTHITYARRSNLTFNTVNKSECIRYVVFECAMNVLSWDVAN